MLLVSPNGEAAQGPPRDHRPQCGGAQSGLYELIRHLPECDHHVATMKDLAPFGPRIRELGVPVHGLQMTDLLQAGRGALRLWRLVRELQPDWIHTWLYHADLFGGLVGRSAGIPVLWHLHVSDLDPSGVKRTTRWVASRCAALSEHVPRRVIACSYATERVHRDLGYAPMEVIDNGVDVDRFVRNDASLRSELGLSPGDFVIGMVARFDPQKDIASFLEAAARLRDRLPRARFVLAGTGMTKENRALNTWIARYRVADIVTRTGFRADVENLYPAFDVFTLSSVSEASSMSLLEAMACEVIPVVTDAGDSVRVVADTGRVVPRRDPEALATGWYDIATRTDQERRTLGSKARERVVAEFSAAEQARRFLEIYSG